MRSPILNIQPSNCHNCRMSALCLPLALDSSSLDQLDKVIERDRPIHKNKYIFHGGDPFRAVYAIRSGAVKSFCISDDGSEQVTGFYLPGEERVASLLLSLSSRLKRQHLSATQFRLPMSRADIGNYLGLTVETVSRVFSRFQSFDLILCDKKEIEIINLNGLSALAHEPKV